MMFLSGYNLRGDIDFWWVGREGGGKNLVGGRGFFQMGRNEQIFGWWGGLPPSPSSREKLQPSMDLTDFNCSYLNKLSDNISKAQKSIFLLVNFNVNLLNKIFT